MCPMFFAISGKMRVYQTYKMQKPILVCRSMQVSSKFYYVSFYSMQNFFKMIGYTWKKLLQFCKGRQPLHMWSCLPGIWNLPKMRASLKGKNLLQEGATIFLLRVAPNANEFFSLDAYLFPDTFTGRKLFQNCFWFPSEMWSILKRKNLLSLRANFSFIE